MWACWFLHTSGDCTLHVLSETIFILILLIFRTHLMKTKKWLIIQLVWNVVLYKHYVLSATQEEKKKKLASSVSYQLSPKPYAARSADWVWFWESPHSLSVTGLLSFPRGGSWQQCAAWLLSHLEVVSVKRLLDRPPPIHAAEQRYACFQMGADETESLRGTQNASGCDSQGKTKGLMPVSLRGKASSHLQKTERESS